ncbi:Hypothetical protein A7982_07541 [Minicystis rosea]|nr:Hypothetical protein A7982_07541 [Minicystis rosea]
MAEYKWLHHLDVLMCNNGGVVILPKPVVDRDTYIVNNLKPVCDKDLTGPCYLIGCSIGCKKIVSIQTGLAKDTELKAGAIPTIGNLSATTDKGCTVTWKSGLSDQLAQAEGRRKHMYVDSEGHPSIGIGFNLDKSGARKQIEALGLDYDKVYAGTQDITDAQVDSLFAQDTTTAQTTARSTFPNFDSFTDTQQKALTDMTFNLGGFSKWPNFVKAVNAGDWEKAAKEAGTGADGKSPSRWVNQVGDRARRIIAQIRGDTVFSPPQ